MHPSHVLLLPGWHGSGSARWQSRWEALHAYQRVEQHDWMRPLRGDWSMRLEETLLGLDPSDGPVVLVAHDLGCQLVAAWAARSRQTARVQAALLVAPADVEREELRARLPSWVPVARQRLPFASRLIASHDDPFCHLERARAFARDWGSDFSELAAASPIHADAGRGDWDWGHAQLQALLHP
jgi:predicted alpha/beta hydrolase family esterase